MNIRTGSAVLFLLLGGFAMAQNPSIKGAGHIFVVRHAERVSETTDALSDRGLARASCLAATLRDADIKTVIVTQFKRTGQTAAPTAAEFKVIPETVKADDYPAILNKVQDAQKLGDVLVVGHGDTVPRLVKGLSRSEGAVGAKEYDKLFVIDGAGITTLHYCPNSTAEPESRMMK